jgi:hypothetical protein
MANIKNAIVGNRMQGLPGVDAWTSSGIAKLPKEPHKSVTLRRIIKVGENNDVLDELANSSDRLRDAIRPYALGVNPMVAVQFQNNSNIQTSLPYKLSSAFRPPIMRQEETLPLSRQHRKTVEITINSVVNQNTEPFYFHKPLKQSLPIEGLQIPSAPKAQKEVSTQGYKIRVGERVQPQEKNKIQSRRVLFENPRVVVLEDKLLKIDKTAALNSKKISVPSDAEVVVLQKIPLHSDVTAVKSSSAGVSRVQPKRFKMNAPIRLPELTIQMKLPTKDNLNRSLQPRMRDGLAVATRRDVIVDKLEIERPEHSLETKMPMISVDAPKHAISGSAKIVSNPSSGVVQRPLSQHNFLHNR